LTGYLAGTLSVPGYLSSYLGRHAAWFSARQVVVALIFIAVFVALVAGPLLLEPVGNFLSKGVKKAAPGGFVLGLVVLLIGLASGVRFIIIAGAAVLGAIVLGVIIDNYLTPVACRGEGPAHPRHVTGQTPRIAWRPTASMEHRCGCSSSYAPSMRLRLREPAAPADCQQMAVTRTYNAEGGVA
jgi:hypothetical protein